MRSLPPHLLALLACGCAASITSGCGGSAHPAATTASGGQSVSGAAQGPGTIQVRIAHHRFIPSHARAKIGQIVVWTNQDPSPHAITARSGAGFTSPRLRPHGTYTYRVTTPGTIRYTGDQRGRMTGTIHVER